ncbi:EAL domain-containing protein [Alkalimonas amylolytica]|uniref:cyclic-guanylate-specific phosphodiesterase n=1 Tax=Alkalimonas amylolytica TaxID=152573 RepID=A0A1H3ZGX9_ALKAM|nr:EAL domain-containing protein [Alkalimonas amylolytica]SEA23013.1 PAS domain S-box-containing protein/diguanylate cyclase (GGDEF) domain-containing protein [Alkalimonas amylolytica]
MQPTMIAVNLLRTNLLLVSFVLLGVVLHSWVLQPGFPAFWLLQSGDALFLVALLLVQLCYVLNLVTHRYLLGLLLVFIGLIAFGWYQSNLLMFKVWFEPDPPWFSLGVLLALTLLSAAWLFRLLAKARYRWLGVHFFVGMGLLLVLLALMPWHGWFWLSFGVHQSMHSFCAVLIALLMSNELLLDKVKRPLHAGIRRIASLFIVAIVFCAVSLWWYLQQIENQALQRQSSEMVEQLLKDKLHELTHYQLLIKRMADRLAVFGDGALDTLWQLDANGYLRDYAALQQLTVLTESDAELLSQGRTEAMTVWYRQQVQHLAQLQQALSNQREDILLVTAPDQGLWLVLLIPLKIKEQPALLVSSLDLAIWAQYLQRTQPGLLLSLRVRAGDRVHHLLPSSVATEIPAYQRLYTTERLLIADSAWQAEVYRDSNFWLRYLGFPPAVLLLLGYLVAFGLMISHSLLSFTNRSRQALLTSNMQLTSSLKQQSELMVLNQAIMTYSRDVLTIVNADGYFVQLSDACETVFGFSRQELMARPFLDFVHPKDQQATREQAEKIQQGQETLDFRNRYLHKNGKIVWLMWSARWVQESNTMFAIARDITALVQQERISRIRTQALQQISTNQPLKMVLDDLCRYYEHEFDDCHCSVMLVKQQRLQLVSAPSMDRQLMAELDGLPLEGDSGVCGAAVRSKAPVLVADATKDARMQSFQQLARQHQIRACWSFPLLAQNNEVLGTFAIYYQRPGLPADAEHLLIDACAQLAVIAIERTEDRRKVQHSEQRYRSLFFSNPDPIFALDLQGNFTAANRAACFLWRQSEQTLLQSSFIQRLPATEQARVTELLHKTAHGSPQTYELTCRLAGALHTLQLSHTPIHVEHQVVGIFVIAKDLTEKLHDQEQLRLFQRAIEASSNGVIITDAREPDHPIVYVNKAFERITGYSAADAMGRNCRFLQGDYRDAGVAEEIKASLETHAECHVLLKNVRKDGTLFWNELYMAPVPDEQGQISHFIGVQNDVTSQKSFEDELAFNASHDILTGLPNRALLHDRLNQGCRMSARSKRSLAVLFIDLDGFKLVNDTLGHLMGDQLLMEVGQRLSEHIRPGDTLARLGGDEFVLLLPELHHEEDVVLIAERILHHLNQTFTLHGQELHISASIGITVSSGELDEPTRLIQQADLAMFKAKQLGHNNYQWYNRELNQELGRQLTLRTELQKAIAAKEFVLHYQPQYDALSNRIIGMEALLRWKHPTLGNIAPADFIPVAEDSGQIIALSEWVLHTACTFAAELQQKGYQGLVMAVNVSSLQFQRTNFIETIQTVLQAHQLPAASLELELTESVLLNQTEVAIHKLHQLNKLGVSISIDDFGTGFSSLSYLKHLPLQKIKIDRSFIRDVIRDRHDAAITKAIISMAHHLQIKVIAEGVETKTQVAFLRKHQCDEFQGYYFAKPMPAKELLTTLAAAQSRLADEDAESSDNHSKKILLLDDEENILKALVRVLRREAYQIYSATNAEQAFELLALHNIQVVVSDQRMPGMSGTEFLSKVKAMYPETVRLVLSGYTDISSVTAAINEGAIYKFLTKPWDDNKLREEIRLAFQHQESIQAEPVVKKVGADSF